MKRIKTFRLFESSEKDKEKFHSDLVTWQSKWAEARDAVKIPDLLVIFKFDRDQDKLGGKSGEYRDEWATRLGIDLVLVLNRLSGGNPDSKFSIGTLQEGFRQMDELAKELVDLVRASLPDSNSFDLMDPKTFPEVWLGPTWNYKLDSWLKSDDYRDSPDVWSFITQQKALKLMEAYNGKTYREIAFEMLKTKGCLIDNKNKVVYYGSDRAIWHKDKFEATIAKQKRKGYGIFTTPDIQVSIEYASVHSKPGRSLMSGASFKEGDELVVYRIVLGDLPFISTRNVNVGKEEWETMVKFGFGGYDGWGMAEEWEHEILILTSEAILEGEPITKQKFPEDFAKIQGYYDEHWRGEFPELLFGR